MNKIMVFANNKFINILKNKQNTVLFCLILSMYIARISYNYILPYSLYTIFNNFFVKILILVVICLISGINFQLALLLAISYILFYEMYNNQNIYFKENFSNLMEIMNNLEKSEKKMDETSEGFECYQKYCNLN
jgi:hypothetical protein